MTQIKLLDCTLRDGGYYTNWDFDQEIVENYFKLISKLPIEYLEIGYRSLPQKQYFGQYYYCPDYLIEKAKALSNKKLAIMLNEKDAKKENIGSLIHTLISKVDLIRLAVDPDNIRRALKLAEEIKRNNFLVGFNVMYMSKWKGQSEFIQDLKYLNGLIDYFYMVDSYGGVYPSDIINIYELVKTHINIPIGFHGHNNIEMALINSLTAIDCGVEMIDATITGMGRGAGNLKTELILTTLNSQGKLDVNFNALSDLTHIFENLQEIYKWGTNLPYMVSGSNSLPQKDVMEWVSKRFFSYNSIIRALHSKKNKGRDEEKFPKFIPHQKSIQVIIIGGGPSVSKHIDALLAFIKKTPGIAIIHASSRNAAGFKGLTQNQFYCLVGNEGSRLEKVFKDLGNFEGECILPCHPRQMGTYVPESVIGKTKELQEPEFTDKLRDTHTALALETAIELNAETIYICGYDGYANALLSNRDLELFNENEFLFEKFKNFTKKPLKSLTPTLYKELEHDSVYSKF